MSAAGDSGGFDHAVATMRPVDLSAVNREAELLTRVDRKYVVGAPELDAFSDAFSVSASILEIDGRRRFTYATTYHDTPERDLYLATARRRPSRFKVRVRDYVDSDATMLEVKAKTRRGRTVKHRIEASSIQAAPVDPEGALTDEMRAFVDTHVASPLTDRLEPALHVRFRRTTVLADSGESRCTIDLGLCAVSPDGHEVAPDAIVIETKSADRASSFDRWLWAHGIRPRRLSKYCTSMAALDASLPANHWHRILAERFPPRRHVRSDAVGVDS